MGTMNRNILRYGSNNNSGYMNNPKQFPEDPKTNFMKLSKKKKKKKK